MRLSRRFMSRISWLPLASLLAVVALAGDTLPGFAQSESAAGPKVIYGEDDRIDVFQETDPDILMYAASTCGLISTGDLSGPANGQYTVSTSTFLNGNACQDEPFRDQPTAPFCSGFMVGPDLIATAGHCIENQNDLQGTYFVFGYEMTDANTLRTTFDENRVYEGVEIVSRALNSQTLSDYAIIRVDRTITSPGAQPLAIRRAGSVSVGTPVGVIGHPTGLPKKIAFGAQTLVRDSSNEIFFMSNLDTYGGNSGSPVFNQNSGVVEGILVRGQTDYISQGGCLRSNELANTVSDTEDVTKTTVFDQFVPELETMASFQLTQTAVKPNDTLEIIVMDQAAAVMGPISVAVTTTGGDSETVTLTEANSGTFTAMLTIAQGAPNQDDGTLQTSDGETIALQYEDDANETIQTSVTVDGTTPVISNVMVEEVGGSSITVSFTTSEPAFASVHVGILCGTFTNQADGILATNHSIRVAGLLPATNYLFSVMVSDAAGNAATGDNGGQCFAVTTSNSEDILTELFSGPGDLQGKSLTFVPDQDTFTPCIETVVDFWVNPDCGLAANLGDDDSALYQLGPGRSFEFFGQTYTEFHVGSNGYVTFGAGDTDATASLVDHFSLPRISAHFTDLDPTSGGRISVTELEDRVAITFDDVPYYDEVLSASFQIELFYDGGIRITWITLDPFNEWLAGLSDGEGTPLGDESDLSAYAECLTSVYGEGACTPVTPVSCFGASGLGGANSLVAFRGDAMALVFAAMGLLMVSRRRRLRAVSGR